MIAENYESKLDEKLKDKIENTHRFWDINKFVILPQKRFYP